MEYRYLATSPEGFIQQVTLFVTKGYHWYVAGRLPEHKEPLRTDARLLAKYDIGLSKWAKARRKRGGGANVQYLRYERFFVLMATAGAHHFYHDEPHVRNVQRVPIKFAQHSISRRRSTVTGKWHASVRITPEAYRDVRAYLVQNAPRWTEERTQAELYRLPFQPYAPVRRQLLNLLRATNRARRLAGRVPVSHRCLYLKRKVVRVFAEPEVVGDAHDGAAV